MDISMLLDMAAQAAPNHVCVTCGEEQVTFADMADRARRHAAALAEDPPVAAAYLGANSSDAIALMFGASIAGVPYVPLNYRWSYAQLESALQRVTPVAVLTDAETRDRVAVSRDVRRIEPAVQPAVEPGNLIGDGDPEATAVLLFTSGTSGSPKAAVLRNRHLVPYVLETVDFANAGPEEAILVSVPPYHIAAVSSVLTSVYAGRRMVQLPQFDPASWVRVARAEEVTQAMVVPTMLNRILDVLEADGDGLPTLRHLSYGGGRMPVAVVERALALLPAVDLVNAYGLTETSSTITLLSPQDHREAIASPDAAVRARLGSVGRPLPSVEVEVRGVDGSLVETGAPGEIWVRGAQVSGEYLTHSAVDASGWYPTADVGHLDAEGFLFLHGRADDVIVRGGENLSPAEIEDRLLEHDAVEEAAVIGVPDEEWGERVEAFVVAAPGHSIDVADLQEWVRRTLRSTRVPTQIHVRAELPYNETGKLLRRELRRELAEASS